MWDFQGFLNDLQDWELSRKDKTRAQKENASSSQLTGSVGVEKASKGDTISFDRARNSPGQYDLSRINDPFNRVHSSFVPEDVPDAVSEKDLGNEFFKQKKFQEAEDDCTEALNLDDRYIKAYSRRATARKELGKIKESMDDAAFALRLEPNNQEIKKQYADAKSLYEKDILQKASGALRSTVQGTQKSQKSEEKINGGSIQPISHSTQKSGLAEVNHHKKDNEQQILVKESLLTEDVDSRETKARSRPQSQGGDGSKEGLSASNSLEQRNHSITKLEMKASVQQLASRAASRVVAEAAKNVTPPTTAYQFEVSWRAFSGDLALQARLLKAISPHELPKIFKNALTSVILIEIIKCLASFFTEDMDLVVSYLEHLTKVPRFDVIVMCLSSTNKDDIRKIWDEVFSSEATPIEYAEILDNLRSKFGLGHFFVGYFGLVCSKFDYILVSFLELQEMGVISRKIFPACGNMCVCCPALRSRSRQPVKRYRKLLADIFPKSPDEPPSERKIIKLCEYAAKNPFRIPKIAKYLEERCYKELRSEHIKLVNIIAESFNKLLSICKVQIAYFAVDVLNVILELLSYSKDETIQTLGCQCLSRFIYCQVDATYTHSIEKLVRKVCMLSQEHGEAREKRCLRASSLQCLSAMVWFMAEFSHIFVDFDEIVHSALDNFDWSRQNEEADAREEAHHNWVDEVIRCEGRGGSVIGNDNRSSCLIIQPRPEVKDPSLLTREEIENPEIWAQICIQRMVELAKESTTMRRVLDPMFVYFDSRQHWAPQKGLAMIVLSRMAYFMENSGNQRLILASVIHHLDHKNVMNDPQLKTCVVQVATSLAMQIRSGSGLAEIVFVGVLCRHLRKSLQASSEFVGEQELNLNISLQNSIDDCLQEIANGVIDAQPLFDLMAITLENIPSGVVGRATIGSLIILARALTLALSRLHSQQGFPEALLVQLLKVMLHLDVEARVGAHLIFSILLFPSSFHTHEISSLRSRYLGQHNKRHSHAASVSASASITALLEKLRRNRDSTKAENHGNIVHDQERDIVAEDWKQGCGLKNSPNFYKFTSIIDRATGSPSLTDTEPYVMKLTEDQMAQLLSAFWIQANLPDNLPSNIEAMAHSFILTLIVLRMKNLKDRDNLVIRFFQLPLSLWTMLLDQSNGIMPPACQRSVYVLSAGMLAFACKIYQIHDLNDVFASLPMSDDFPSNSAGGEDDTISEASVSDLSRFIPKMPISPSAPQVISIGQLMESALEVAGQVAGTAISTSPLPYNAMASQCESLGTCARKKLSNWLAFENHYSQAPDKSFLAIADIRNSALEKVANGVGHAQLPRDPMKLPPASPFDNFLKAAGYMSFRGLYQVLVKDKLTLNVDSSPV
ncbi:RNA polymerase II-associated protein 3 [Glycine soja]